MNRLDEIKERLDKVTHLRGNKGFDAREEFESCAEADIDYLLSLNERVVAALETIEGDLISGHPKFALETARRILHSLKKNYDKEE